VTMTVAADTGSSVASVDRTDPALRLTGGPFKIPFTIKAGDRSAAFQTAVTGTVASVVTVAVGNLQTNGLTFTRQAGATTRLVRSVPVVTNVCYAPITDGFNIDISGTVTYNADLTYSSNVHETFTGTETIPLSCLGFASCAAVVSDSPDSTLTCTGTTTCTCQIGGSPAGNESGTYSLSGTNLTMVGPDDTTTNTYCVQNGQLHLMETSETSGAVIGDFVAQKQ